MGVNTDPTEANARVGHTSPLRIGVGLVLTNNDANLGPVRTDPLWMGGSADTDAN